MRTRVEKYSDVSTASPDTLVVRRPEAVNLVETSPQATVSGPDTEVYLGTPKEVAKRMGWPVCEGAGEDALNEALTDWHIGHSPIFRYAFIYPDALRNLVHAFAATASDAWSRARAQGEMPEDWQITPLSEGAEMLVLNATLGQASQYGSVEQLARRTAEFGDVGVVQWLSPDVPWNGMTLTNPVTGASEPYAPGEARITTLGIDQHEQVTAQEIPARAGYTVV